MLETLKSRLRVAVNFPSPPAIALQIIDLANDPEISAAKVAALIGKDAGLATKVLRVANSPLYSKRRKSDNLRQALVTLGLNATVSLALGFSLVGNYQSAKGSGVDYPRFWRRSILSAAAARQWAMAAHVANADDVFLAALLQDIAVLAIDRVQKGFYAELQAEATHAQLIEFEVARMGADHAQLGAWLLRQWKLPETLCAAVEGSHLELGENPAARCVSIASECADVLLAGEANSMRDLAQRSAEALGIEPNRALETLLGLTEEIPEIERLFDVSILDADFTSAILDQARELLSIRSAEADRNLELLKADAAGLQDRVAQLEKSHQRDALTGVLSRAYIDELLLQEFLSAEQGGWPLSVVFADLDAFKKINDTFGHAAGDAVLAGAAKAITAVLRDTDFVGRYGGEEFLIILPGAPAEIARRVCDRLLAGLRETRHSLAVGSVQVTISLGLATYSREVPFPSAKALTEAADRSLYAAKRAGRDRVCMFGDTSSRKTSAA